MPLHEATCTLGEISLLSLGLCSPSVQWEKPAHSLLTGVVGVVHQTTQGVQALWGWEPHEHPT